MFYLLHFITFKQPKKRQTGLMRWQNSPPIIPYVHIVLFLKIDSHWTIGQSICILPFCIYFVDMTLPFQVLHAQKPNNPFAESGSENLFKSCSGAFGHSTHCAVCEQMDTSNSFCLNVKRSLHWNRTYDRMQTIQHKVSKSYFKSCILPFIALQKCHNPWT